MINVTKEKYPEIWAAFEKAKAELAPLEAKRAKEMIKMNAVAKEMDVLRIKKGVCHDKACVDLEEMGRLRKEISTMALAMGAIRA